MVKPLCDEASSLLFLNDGSFPAKQFLHDFLLTHTTAPVQLADMTTWLSDEQTPSDYYQNNHNTEFSLTMIVFYNASLVGMLLASLPYGHLLVEANTGRHLSLVQTQVLKDARLRYTLTTYLPFKPGTDRFCVQTLNPLEAMTRQHLVQDRFPSFHGHVLHLASWTDNFPVMFFDDFTTNTTVAGLGLIILTEIGSIMNFTYTVQYNPPDYHWGDFINGTWMGMAGQLVRREKDLIINTFSVLYERMAVMDFSVVIFSDSFSAVLKMPKPEARWAAVVYPFTEKMWVALVISLALITLFFHLFITNSPTSVYTHRADVLSTMVWLMRSIVKQGFSSIPNISGCRPFLICWWLATLVLSTSYVSNLIAFITVPGQPNKIRTLKELVESHHPLYIADYGSFIPSYMATSNDPLYLKMSQKLNYLLEYSDIIDQVYQSEAAFLEGTNYIEFLNIPFEYY
ncbi:Glutamate receptor ionotropic, delta-1-like 1, partial [Homarus americanus]